MLSGMCVWGSGFRVVGLGLVSQFRVWRFGVSRSLFRVAGSGFRVSGFAVSGCGFGFGVSRFRVSRFRVEG